MTPKIGPLRADELSPLVELTRVCYMCPACWTGRTADGKEIHAHYRHKEFYVEVDGERVLWMPFEKGMNTDDMLRLSGLRYYDNPHRVDADAWDQM